MATNFSREHQMDVQQASRECGRTRQTLLRWILFGCRGGIKLEAAKNGGTWVTSREAIQRFRDRLTEQSLGRESDTGAPPTAQASAAHQLAIESNERAAMALG